MKNLLAEMARYGVSKYDIQKLLGCSEATVRNKLSGESEFTVPEALKIRNSYFIGFRVEYLFVRARVVGCFSCERFSPKMNK